MPYSQLLDQLKNHTYIKLNSSKIQGIGVFAIKDISKGCRGLFSNGKEEWIKVPIHEVEKLPGHSRSLIETYCLFDEENYFVPEFGFKMIDPVIYLNHSSHPNIISINDGEDFEALHDILAGEELLIHYGELADGLDDYQ